MNMIIPGSIEVETYTIPTISDELNILYDEIKSKINSLKKSKYILNLIIEKLSIFS